MSGVYVLAVMDDFSEDYRLYIPQFHAQNRKGMKRRVSELNEARAAVAELMKCCEVTVKAFEALGRNDGIVAQIESIRECERALVEQKAALARCRGGAA